MNNQKVIIWDWNGTLLDDVNISVDAINAMLIKRKLKPLTIEEYRQVFSFPVIEYYKRIGFNLENENWDEVSTTFINEYQKRLPQCKLTQDAEIILKHYKHKGYKQIIISAMHQPALEQSIHELGINHYFDFIGGADDHYAHGKTQKAVKWFSQFNYNPANITFVGDSIHDSEVATALGCECILLSSGHMAKDRLLGTARPVIENILNLKNFIL